MKLVHCPVCTACKTPILKEGVIIHGNANIVNVLAPDGDGGGFVGSNFPNGAFTRDGTDSKLTFTLSEVKKSHYHWECFVLTATDHMKQADDRVEKYLKERDA